MTMKSEHHSKGALCDKLGGTKPQILFSPAQLEEMAFDFSNESKARKKCVFQAKEKTWGVLKDFKGFKDKIL